MEISVEDFILEEIRYAGFLRALPVELQIVCPPFHRFLSPSNWSMIDDDHPSEVLRRNVSRFDDTIELSITGAQRWAMLKSPHAQTLIRIYALQRLNKELNDASNRTQPRGNPSKETL